MRLTERVGKSADTRNSQTDILPQDSRVGWSRWYPEATSSHSFLYPPHLLEQVSCKTTRTTPAYPALPY